MDQTLLAGIGNVYADEILFQARIHPKAPARELGRRELVALYRTMARVLERAISAGADPARMPRTWLTPARGHRARCPRCGGPLETMSAAGRTSYVCPHCQGRR